MSSKSNARLFLRHQAFDQIENAGGKKLIGLPIERISAMAGTSPFYVRSWLDKVLAADKNHPANSRYKPLVHSTAGKQKG